MATSQAELCGLLTRDAYGDLPAQVFNALAQHGRTPLHVLFQLVALSAKHVRHGLTVLVQQHLVLHITPQEENVTYYEVDWEGAYNLLRSGKIIALVEDRYGLAVAQVISNLLQLGHAKVGDLEDAYKFTPKDRQAIDSAAEHINDEGMPNGMVNGHPATKGQDRKISSKTQLHSALFRLLDSGLVARVRERTYLSAADRQTEAEVIVKREKFPDGKITGPKAKVNFQQEVDTLKRRWRDEDDEVGGDTYKRTIGHSNGRPHKRQRTNGGMTNGSNHHDDSDDEGFQVVLERDVVLKINHEKCTVALRSQQIEQYATRFFGETTAKVYGVLLMLLEKKISRCRDDLKEFDEADEAEEDNPIPPVTTLEVLDRLDPSLDLESTIHFDSGGLTNGYHPKDEPNRTLKYEHDDYADEDETISSAKARNKRLTQIEQHLHLVVEHPRGFVDRVGNRGKGEWRVNYPALMRNMQRAEVENIVNARFGSLGARLVRMLSKKGKLEEKQVCTHSLLRAKDVRSLLTSMQECGLIETQEVPKDQTRQPSRATYLWYFDHERCCKVLLADTYKAMCRLIQRIDKQRDEVQDVIDKAERLDVVGHEDEYLTPSDKAHLRRWREQEEKLLTQLNRQDDMVALLRDF